VLYLACVLAVYGVAAWIWARPTPRHRRTKRAAHRARGRRKVNETTERECAMWQRLFDKFEHDSTTMRSPV